MKGMGGVMRTVDLNEWLANFIKSTDRITSGHGDLLWRWLDWQNDVLPTLRQIAERLEAGSVMPRSDAVVNFGVGSRPVGHICYRAVGIACSVCDAKGVERMEARRPATPMAICSYAGPQDVYSCGEEATATMVDGPRCEKHLGVWADRVTATEVPVEKWSGKFSFNGTEVSPLPLLSEEAVANIQRNMVARARAAMEGRSDHLAHLGLAKAPPEPCICPPGAVSRSCRAVGFRSGIMHKDRE